MKERLIQAAWSVGNNNNNNNRDNKVCLLVDYSASSLAAVFFNSPEEIIPGKINYISITYKFF